MITHHFGAGQHAAAHAAHASGGAAQASSGGFLRSNVPTHVPRGETVNAPRLRGRHHLTTLTFEPAVTLYEAGPPPWCLWRPVNQASSRVLKSAVARAVRLAVLQPNGRAVYSGGFWFTWRRGGQLLYCTRQGVGRVPVDPGTLGRAMTAGVGLPSSNGDGTFTCDDGTCVMAADPVQATTNCALGITTSCPAPAAPFVVSSSTDSQGNVIVTWSDGTVTTTCAIDGSSVSGDPSNCPQPAQPAPLPPITPSGGGGGGGGGGPLPPPIQPKPSTPTAPSAATSSSPSTAMIVAGVAAVVALGAGGYALLGKKSMRMHAHDNPVYRRMSGRR